MQHISLFFFLLAQNKANLCHFPKLKKMEQTFIPKKKKSPTKTYCIMKFVFFVYMILKV